jgi:small conductance mechanosensitive channel
MEFDLAALTPQLVDYATRLGGALIFLVGAWSVAGWSRRAVQGGLTKADFDPTLTLFFGSVVRWAILVMAFLACLGMFGIQTTSFAAVIGAAGLAIGLAFQGALSNVASGMMLLIFRPFTIGDVVAAGGVTGTVAEIQLFTTTFDTADNRRIIVPNALIFGDTIENVTHHDTRRVSVDVGTDYGADLDHVRTVLEATLPGIPGVLADPAPQVFLSALGASSIDWQVRVWCATGDFWGVHQATVRATKQALDGAGVGIPFPQMDVHLDGGLARGGDAAS